MSPPSDLEALLEDLNEATAVLRQSETVPQDLFKVVDSLESRLHADAPLQVVADPYLTTMLFAGAFRAEKALRHDDVNLQRKDLRVALEQVRHALRDIVANRPFGADTPVKDVLANAVAVVSLPQRELAELLGTSTRQLQRWLAPDGPSPAGYDEARVRIVAQLVNQLRHVFTGPGVVTWFNRKHPVLGDVPRAWLDDPIHYPDLLAAATGSRAMTA